MIEIKLAEKQDLSQCAEILRDIQNNNVLSEGWTVLFLIEGNSKDILKNIKE